MDDSIPIDPALTAIDEPYRPSLSGIFPSSSSRPQEPLDSLAGGSIGIDYKPATGVDQSGGEASPNWNKKRKKATTEGEEDKPKKSRQSREFCQQT